ncbi:MAG: PAS domain S-box protein [Anaerolineales bacterium]|nr:PAS domain S-box protein [Anaerolineales bacterium]
MVRKTTSPSTRNMTDSSQGNENTLANMAAVIHKLETELSRREANEVNLQQEITSQKAVLDAIPAPVYHKDTQGRYIGANKAFLDFFGFSEQNLQYKKPHDLYPKELAGVISAKDSELLHNPGQQEYEITLPDFNQVPHDFIAYKSTFCDDEGVVKGIIGVLQDITKRKQAEEALRNSEQRLREIVENADEIIFTLSPDGIFTYASPGWTRLLGYQVQEVIGYHFVEYIHPDDMHICEKTITKALNSGETSKEIEYQVLHKNGEWRWHNTVGTPINDEFGKPIYIVGISKDITERKQTEAALKAATEELEHFFSSTIDLLCIANIEGYFLRLNREWEKVLGYRLEELEGQRFLDFVHPDDIQPTRHAISELASNIEVFNFVNRYRCKDGTYRWLEWRSMPVGEKIYAAARDITERINQENALRESEERYRNFVINASEGIFRIDFSKSILIDQPYEVLEQQIAKYAYIAEVNAALSAAYGLNPEQMIGRPVRDFAPNCGTQMADLTKAENYRITDREETELDSQGNPIVIVESYTGVVDNGILKRVWGVQRDITQRKRAEQLISLQHDLALSLNAVSRLDEGLQLCLEVAIESSGMDCGGIYLYDELSKELRLAIHQGLSDAFVNAMATFKANSLNMRLVMDGKPVYSQHPMLGFPDDEPRRNESLSGIAVLPINYQNKIIGSMNIASHSYKEVPTFSREILETIAAQMGNVIARLKSEEDLRESELRFRSIFDHSQDGILVADCENQKIMFGNQTISQMLGYTPEELTTLHAPDIHPESVKEEVWEQFIKSGNDETSIAYEIPVRRKDGSMFIAEIVNSQITLQGKPYLAGMFRDITERKQSERAIRDNEEMLSSILEATPVGVALLKNRIFIKSNKSLSLITGYSEEELLGSSTRLLYPNENEYARVGKYLYQEMDEKGLAVGEARLEHKNGFTIDVILCLSPFDPNDQSKGVTATVLDISERKKVENSLRENEALISSLFAAAPVGIALLKDRVFLKVNQTLCDFSGYTETELLGQSTRILYPDDDEYIRIGNEIYGKIEKDGLGFGETRFTHKDGSNIDIYLCLSPLDPDDISKGITAIFMDNTDRKQAERALRENEAFISSLFASVPVGIALLKDRKFIKVNNTLYKLTGYCENELLNQDTRMVYPSDEEYIRTGNDLYGQIAKDGVGIGEAQLLHKNGTVLDVLLCLSPLDLTDISKGITTTVIDITDRKQAEMALRESEKKYRSVIENIQDVFYRSNLAGQLVMGSPSGCRMFGYDTIDEMIGMSLELFWENPDDRDKIIEAVKATGRVKNYEARLKRKDGSIFIASFATHVLYDDDGNPVGTEGIIRDITEQKKAEEEIRQLNEDLEQRVFERTRQLETAVQELEAFSYSVSHDLRAPLRAINGYASILIEDYYSALDEDGKRVCSVISKETRRMSRLIDDLLAFARIGRTEMLFKYVDMQALVNLVYQDLLTPDEKLRITFQVTPLECAMGDANLLRQVWTNLISNAVKFTSQKEQAIIHISSHQNEKEVIYSIKDNGAGFDMRYAQNLFGVFNRLHSEKEFEGTGVGLAIVQRVINRHGGRVWAEGEVGNGATFHFSLPKRESIS